ncbi:MAG: hypothetical protein Q8M92_10700 [Candidatus Subteraquimicrobiales bacterium]|nr:hypothetical protein [Candidatus Subteraquimicrobiales bacterium]
MRNIKKEMKKVNKKIMPTLLILVLAISSIGAAFGADNAKLEGMNPDKSIGNVGIMNFTNTTQGGGQIIPGIMAALAILSGIMVARKMRK